MSLISLRDLDMITLHPLFQNLMLNIGLCNRVGLVAGDGAGKSTLLRYVAGQIEPDIGSVVVSRGANLGFVEQEMSPALLTLPLEEVLRRVLPAAERQTEAWRVHAVLDEFDTPEAVRARPIGALSGGWPWSPAPWWPAMTVASSMRVLTAPYSSG